MPEMSNEGLGLSIAPEGTTNNERVRHNGISVVIRVRNEKDNLEHLLNALDRQTIKPLEIIVVDNESDDGTRELALSRGAKVVEIPKEEFTYPKAINLGIEHASGELITLISAHSFPINDDFLERGAMYFQEPEVAGVYSGTIPRKDTSRTDRFLSPFIKLTSRRWQTRVEDKMRFGIMGATNCMLRKSLWEKRHFDESFGAGGEDGDWAKWVLETGYSIINDSHFTVEHSHGLGPLGWIKQMQELRRVSNPRPFDAKTISYRRSEN
jgi:glycosyltransferase involved in cell wall biosynthesis